MDATISFRDVRVGFEEGDIVRGRGFAYALYVHSKFPGYGAAWSAWIADVAVRSGAEALAVLEEVLG